MIALEQRTWRQCVVILLPGVVAQVVGAHVPCMHEASPGIALASVIPDTNSVD